MDWFKFSSLRNENLSNLTDSELVALQTYSRGVINYNRDQEVIESIGELGFDILNFLESISPWSRAATVATRATEAYYDYSVNMDDAFRQADTELAKRFIQEIDWRLEFRRDNYPFAGPNDGVASRYDGIPDNDGESPDVSLEDERSSQCLVVTFVEDKFRCLACWRFVIDVFYATFVLLHMSCVRVPLATKVRRTILLDA